MATESTNPIQKRRRFNGTHRWTEEETQVLVQQVADEVKHRPESFEKPTAQHFYKKISSKSATLCNLEWVPMKNKMRHLKSTFVSAITWKNQTGAGILATGEEQSVKDNILKICPYWELLGQIFGQRKGVNPTVIVETSTESQDSVCSADVTVCSSIDFDAVEEDGFDASENFETSTPETSLDFTALKDTLRKRQVAPKTKSANPFSMLINLQEKKLEIEVKKFELEKDVTTKEMELKKVQLEQEFELRKLQLESDERVRKYELELKFKSSNTT